MLCRCVGERHLALKCSEIFYFAALAFVVKYSFSVLFLQTAELMMAYSSKIMAQNKERIRTVVRIRPLSGAEVSGAHLNIISVYSGTSLRLIDPIALGVGSKALSTAEDKLYHERSFSFDVVYSATSTQEDVYEGCGEPLVQHCLQGFNCSILAYGTYFLIFEIEYLN